MGAGTAIQRKCVERQTAKTKNAEKDIQRIAPCQFQINCSYKNVRPGKRNLTVMNKSKELNDLIHKIKVLQSKIASLKDQHNNKVSILVKVHLKN